MERKISSKKYFLAFILTIAVFSGGILAGIFLENARLKDSRQNNLQNKVNLQSLQLQQKYIEKGTANCNALNQILETNVDELAKKMVTVISYKKNAFFNENEFKLQLRDYFLTEIQFLLAAQEIDKKCRKDNVKVVYFYDENKQDMQGKVLDYLRKLFDGRLLVFSFDSNFAEEPMIKILLASYNIKTFPAAVVENTAFQGFTPIEELFTAICAEFKKIEAQIPEQCLIVK